MRGLFINELGACSCAPFKIKCIEPVTTAALIGAGASLVGGMINSSTSANMNSASREYDWMKTQDLMYFNDEQAQKAREHQSHLLQAEQDWNERMYNDYQSPLSLRRQYEEAGYNPYLVESSGHIAGNMPTSQSAPTGVSASAPNTGQPPQFMPDLSGIGRAGEMLLQGSVAKANVANQSAQTVSQALQNYVEMSKLDIPKDVRDGYLRNQLGMANGVSFDADRFINEMDYRIKGQKIQNEWNELLFSIDKEFGRTERADKVMNMEQQFSVMAAEIGRMAVQNKIDEATIDKFASEIARNFAAAGLDSANAGLIRRSMQFLVNSAQYTAFGQYYDALTSKGEYSKNKPIYDAVESGLGQRAEQVDYYTGKVVDKVGKLMKVNIGYSNSNVNSRAYQNVRSWQGNQYIGGSR